MTRPNNRKGDELTYIPYKKVIKRTMILIMNWLGLIISKIILYK